jgi:hypothetical protein
MNILAALFLTAASVAHPATPTRHYTNTCVSQSQQSTAGLTQFTAQLCAEDGYNGNQAWTVFQDPNCTALGLGWACGARQSKAFYDPKIGVHTDWLNQTVTFSVCTPWGCMNIQTETVKIRLWTWPDGSQLSQAWISGDSL